MPAPRPYDKQGTTRRSTKIYFARLCRSGLDTSSATDIYFAQLCQSCLDVTFFLVELRRFTSLGFVGAVSMLARPQRFTSLGCAGAISTLACHGDLLRSAMPEQSRRDLFIYFFSRAVEIYFARLCRSGLDVGHGLPVPEHVAQQVGGWHRDVVG